MWEMFDDTEWDCDEYGRLEPPPEYLIPPPPMPRFLMQKDFIKCTEDLQIQSDGDIMCKAIPIETSHHTSSTLPSSAIIGLCSITFLVGILFTFNVIWKKRKKPQHFTPLKIQRGNDDPLEISSVSGAIMYADTPCNFAHNQLIVQHNNIENFPTTKSINHQYDDMQKIGYSYDRSPTSSHLFVSSSPGPDPYRSIDNMYEELDTTPTTASMNSEQQMGRSDRSDVMAPPYNYDSTGNIKTPMTKQTTSIPVLVNDYSLSFDVTDTKTMDYHRHYPHKNHFRNTAMTVNNSNIGNRLSSNSFSNNGKRIVRDGRYVSEIPHSHSNQFNYMQQHQQHQQQTLPSSSSFNTNNKSYHHKCYRNHPNPHKISNELYSSSENNYSYPLDYGRTTTDHHSNGAKLMAYDTAYNHYDRSDNKKINYRNVDEGGMMAGKGSEEVKRLNKINQQLSRSASSSISTIFRPTVMTSSPATSSTTLGGRFIISTNGNNNNNLNNNHNNNETRNNKKNYNGNDVVIVSDDNDDTVQRHYPLHNNHQHYHRPYHQRPLTKIKCKTLDRKRIQHKCPAHQHNVDAYSYTQPLFESNQSSSLTINPPSTYITSSTLPIHPSSSNTHQPVKLYDVPSSEKPVTATTTSVRNDVTTLDIDVAVRHENGLQFLLEPIDSRCISMTTTNPTTITSKLCSRDSSFTSDSGYSNHSTNIVPSTDSQCANVLISVNNENNNENDNDDDNKNTATATTTTAQHPITNIVA